MPRRRVWPSVDDQVRRQDEEVLEPVGQVQVSDECTHQPGLADTGRHGKAQGRELPLEGLKC
jgi:hypothetical protein